MPEYLICVLLDLWPVAGTLDEYSLEASSQGTGKRWWRCLAAAAAAAAAAAVVLPDKC